MAIDTPERPQRPENKGNNTGTGSLSPIVERQLQEILQRATPAKEGLAVPPNQPAPHKGNPLLTPSPSRRAVPPASKSTLPPLEAFRKAPLVDSPVTQPTVPSKTRSPFPVFGTPKYWKLLWKAIKYGLHDRFSMSKEDLQRREA